MKRFAILLALGLIGLANGQFDPIIREGLEKARQIMKTGDPELGIPIMDPLYVDQLAINNFNFLDVLS